MLLDVTLLLLLLHPGPRGLAGDFQHKDCHGEMSGGYSRSRTLSHHGSVEGAVIPAGVGGQLGAPVALPAHLQDLVLFGICEQHGAVPGPGGCRVSQAAAIGVASVPCMWELHGHVGRTDPSRSCCGWLLVPALLQPELILSPSPKGLQGTGAAVPALLGKDQADTSDGEAACIGQWEQGRVQPPVLGQGTGQPLSPAGSQPGCSAQPGARSRAWGASCPWPLP